MLCVWTTVYNQTHGTIMDIIILVTQYLEINILKSLILTLTMMVTSVSIDCPWDPSRPISVAESPKRYNFYYANKQSKADIII